jgi:phage gp36-like protein
VSTKVPVTILALGSQAASGTGASVDLGVATTARLWLEATVAATTLTVTVQHSHNGTTWETLGSFAVRTTVGAELKSFPGARRYVRVSWTGTGTWTFGVTGESVQVYATPSDVKLLGIRSDALGGTNAVTDAELDEAAEAAGDLMDGYFKAGGIALPLTSWGDDIRRADAIIAAYDVISARIGYNPDATGDDPWRKRYEDIIRWLEQIAAGAIVPGVAAPTPTTTTGRVAVVSTGELRGW